MKWKKMFKTKNTANYIAEVGKGNSLSRTLGLKDMVFIGVGGTIGTGIFVITGIGAAQYAGPAITISFLLASLANFFYLFTVAELAGMIPLAGTTYNYAYVAFGQLAAWIVGWNIISEYLVATAGVATGWSAYVNGLFNAAGFYLPQYLTACPANGGFMDLPAAMIVIIITCLLFVGIKESIKLNNFLVYVKIGAILLFLGLALPYVNLENWHPYMPFAWNGVTAGAAVVFFSYLGFDVIANSAEEAKNPQRTLPLSIIICLIIVTCLYVAVAAVLTGVVYYPELKTAEPIAFALNMLGYSWGAALVAVGAVCGMTTVLLATLYGLSRIFFAVARDKMIPHSLCRIHKKFHTPYIVTWVCGLTVAALAAFLPIDNLIELANIGTFFFMIVSAVAVVVLRYSQPEAHRPFRCPTVWIMCLGTIITCLYLSLELSWLSWARFIVWTIIGIIIYFVYGIRQERNWENK